MGAWVVVEGPLVEERMAEEVVHLMSNLDKWEGQCVVVLIQNVGKMESVVDNSG